MTPIERHQEIVNPMLTSIEAHSTRTAFVIAEQEHSYAELHNRVSAIRRFIRARIPAQEKLIGILAEDHLDTYAAILALWAEGRGYVPLALGTPAARLAQIIEQSGVRTVLGASIATPIEGAKVQRTSEAPANGEPLEPCRLSGEEVAYLLFTSGTTGRPKGVPITHRALAAFVAAFEALGLGIHPSDRVLQMFELTFDLSVMSYAIPLLHGASVLTVPGDALKYTYIHALLEDRSVTVALMVPSILNFLRPYFDEILCPSLRANLFCGEALPLDLLEEWCTCIPNARVLNVYGPTEHTIFCTAYEYQRNAENGSSNGILSIGKAMLGTTVGLVDEHGNWSHTGQSGELTLSGSQATLGYWRDEERTTSAFIHPESASPQRHYRTGDRCSIDEDGTILYWGRMDDQVKVQGYRVELAEIEHFARRIAGGSVAVAIAVTNHFGHTELVLVLEGPAQDKASIINRLKEVLPSYMIPARVEQLSTLPLNANGKIDRPALKRQFGSAK